jgi:hypothetical protein
MAVFPVVLADGSATATAASLCNVRSVFAEFRAVFAALETQVDLAKIATIQPEGPNFSILSRFASTPEPRTRSAAASAKRSDPQI